MNTTEKPSTSADYLNNGLVNGTKFRSLSPNNASGDLDLLIDDMNGSWEDGERPIQVIDMFTFPEAFSSTDANDNRYRIYVTHPTTLAGYTPKNKKLYGYPYSFLLLTTKDGDGCTLKWEYFAAMLATNNTAEFAIYGSPIGGGQIQCYPRDYNGIVDNLDSGFVMNDFPKNPFSYDAYQAWVAAGGQIRLEREKLLTNIRGIIGITKASFQAGTDIVLGGLQMGQSMVDVSKVDTALSKNISGMASGANRAMQGMFNWAETIVDVKEAKDKINYKFKDAAYQPNIVVGAASPAINVSQALLNFYFISVHVRKDELTRLDDFFSCYGYAVNKVKAPNITGRQYWNFVQTQNAVIVGDMPSSSREAIGRIFDGGITFWHNGDQVGNYRQSVSNDSIDNPIVT